MTIDEGQYRNITTGEHEEAGERWTNNFNLKVETALASADPEEYMRQHIAEVYRSPKFLSTENKLGSIRRSAIALENLVRINSLSSTNKKRAEDLKKMAALFRAEEKHWS